LTPGISAGAGTVSGGNITNSSSNAQTLNIPVNLSAGNHTITTAAGSGALNLSGTFSRATGGTAVFTRAGGNINFSNSGLANDGSLGGGLLGGWAILGSEWAALDAGGNVIAYNGYTTVNPANAIANGSTQNIKIPSSGGNVTLATAGTTDINTLIYSGTTANQTVEVGVGNILRLGAQGGIYNAAQANGTAPAIHHRSECWRRRDAHSIQNGVDLIGLAKQGAGRLLLIGANTSLGPTNVTAGTLLVGDGVSGSLNGTSSVSVTSGATLGGSGTIMVTAGNVTLTTGASLAPGISAGTLTFDLGLGMLDVTGAAGGASAFKFELGVTSDKVALTSGPLSIGNGLLNLNDFVFTDAGGFAGGSFTLFDGASPIVGTLGSSLSGTVLGLNATLGLADNGNDLVLVVVPEPGTAFALLAGLSALALRRKRTRDPI
jgi:hypothetical protein